MVAFAFCPNPRCELHLATDTEGWYIPFGNYLTKAFGKVSRFRCTRCGTTFSTQTFSVDYYAKRRVDYADLARRHEASESLRAIARGIGVSCATVQNRLDRLARQSLALHAGLRPLARRAEDVSIDGFVSYEVSQYFPSEITISIAADSRFVLDISHATRRRSGSMTKQQRKKSSTLYDGFVFEKKAVERTFADVLTSLEKERAPAKFRPLIIITDEKKEYVTAMKKWRAWREQDETARVAHIRVSSRLPRTFDNPLFPSNYIDREIRKDQANHRRETVCFARNVANGMSRLALYLVCHNYRKRYRIKAPAADTRVHAELAGIDRALIDTKIDEMFNLRAFRSRIRLGETLDRIWTKSFQTPLKRGGDYLPRFVYQ